MHALVRDETHLVAAEREAALHFARVREERLKPKLSDREFLELAVTVALANFTNRISETLRLEISLSLGLGDEVVGPASNPALAAGS